MPKLVKEIVGPASWTLKDGTKYTLTPDDIQQMRDTGLELIRDGFSIQAPFFHDEQALPVMVDKMSAEDRQQLEHSGNNAGFWEDFWVDPNGKLVGKLDVPREEDAAKIGKTIKGCSAMIQEAWQHPQVGNEKVYPKAMTHIALTNRPKAKDAAPFEPTIGMALSMEMADHMVNIEGESKGQMSNLLAELEEIGISLPEDTTPENLPERLMVAVKAINAASEGGGKSVDEPPEGARIQKPTPVVMALSEAAQEFVADKLGMTPEEIELEAAKPKPVPMSVEQKAAMNFATGTAKKSQLDRIETLVTEGRMLPKEAAEINERYLGDGFRVAFSENGTPEESELDRVLQIYERREPGEKLTGLSDDQITMQVWESPGGKRFSLSEMIKQQAPGKDLDAKSEEDDPEELDKQIDDQLKQAGYATVN